MNRKWWTLTAVSAATFMLLLDITVVNVALPSIRQDLGASFTDLQWVVDAYALPLAALVLSAGSLADRLGRRRVFAAGLSIFSAASLLCALAPTPGFLNLSRAVQGVGGAAMFAVSLALIAHEFPAGRQRGAAMGVYGATIGGAVAIGPLVGGTLTDALGWESIFYLNLPIGAAAIAITQTRLRESRDPKATRLDWMGVMTFSGALFLLVLALLHGNDEGWSSSPILAMFAGAAALLGAFFVIERRVSQPMLPLGLFRNPAFTGVQLAAFAISCAMLAQFLYLTLYLQNYLRHTPFQTGVRYLPITLASFVVAPIAGALLSRLPARLLIGSGLAAAGAGLLLMAGIEATSQWTTLLAGFLVAGAGIGLLNPAIADVAVSVVPEAQSGTATGINDTFRQVGIAVGTAVWGALLIGRGADKVGELTAGTPAATDGNPSALVEAVSSGSLNRALTAVPPQARDAVAHAANQGFLTGLNAILALGAGVSFVGALLAMWLIRERAIRRDARGEEPASPEMAALPATDRRAGQPRPAHRRPDIQHHIPDGAPPHPGEDPPHTPIPANDSDTPRADLPHLRTDALAAYQAAAEQPGKRRGSDPPDIANSE